MNSDVVDIYNTGKVFPLEYSYPIQTFNEELFASYRRGSMLGDITYMFSFFGGMIFKYEVSWEMHM